MTGGRNANSRGGQSVTDRHRAWLELVDRDGPFVAIPALKRVWPQGIGQIPEAAKAALRDAKPAFDQAWDQWTRLTSSTPTAHAPNGDDETEAALTSYRDARDVWVTTVLQDVIGWGKHLTVDLETLPNPAGSPGVPSATSPDHRVAVPATAAFRRDHAVGALVLVVDPVTSLRDPSPGDWAASPIDRMDALLRASGHPIGIVTDGRWWGIISAQAGVMSASGVVDAQTWIEETDVRDAFVALTEPRRLVGGAEGDRLPALFRESVAAAEEITVALGTQVRRAVELLVTAFSEAALDARAAGRPDPLPADHGQVYDGAVTAMMRVVFLLFAEERSMIRPSPLFVQGYGVSDELDALDARAREEGAEALDATHHTWHRLLATSQALYSGVNTEDMRLPAYGGSLFDPARYPFLLATATDGTDAGALQVTVSDRVMLEVLRAVQYATIGGENRRISFRDVDVEQIGYIYEGLLGYTARQVGEVTVGLVGKAGEEPEVGLDLLDDLWEQHADDTQAIAALLAWLKKEQPAATPKSATALKKLLATVPDDAERALIAATPNADLRVRLRPYVGIIRRDLRSRPVVIPPGGLAVFETPSRANAGAHYTPKALAQEVVLHALEPLVYSPGPHQTPDRDKWRLISSDQILDLKVADIACGSGAFLVAAAEYLAEKLVEAWSTEGFAIQSPPELQVRARREIVAHCLYGADINAMAVEMCKLSLWLVSLDPDQPFSFVDDKVLHGNSLLGLTDVRQLEVLHIDPSRTKESIAGVSAFSEGTLFGEGSEASGADLLDVRAVLKQAARKREALATPITESDPARSGRTKQRLLREIRELTATASLLADGVIGAGLRHGGKPGKKLDETYEDLRRAVDAAKFQPDDDGVYRAGGDTGPLDSIVERGLTPEVVTDYERWRPLHWAVSVPDVLARDGSGHGGFDAVIGNPPFLGGSKLSGTNGSNVREWLVNVLADGTTGNSDLVGYFFLRACSLLTSRGTLGLIATNTIAQGDTRQVGLDRIVESGFTITRAIQSRRWPAESANLEYAAVWGTAGPVADTAQRVSDGASVKQITTLLEPGGRVEGLPSRLSENEGLSFEGMKIYGQGFVLNPAEAAEWIAIDPKNAEVVFPYLSGEDLNQRPDGSGSRWVIDFNDWTEERAQSYQLAYARVAERVKPERQRLKPNGEYALRRPLPQRWWQYGEKRPALRRAIANLPEVLAITHHSKSVMPMRVPTGQVFSHALALFATDSYTDQAVLSSGLHQLWAITYGSSMRTDTRYTPSDVFEPFPRPTPSDPGIADRLAEAGRTLDGERREIMFRRGLGLTQLYNMVNDPAVTDDEDLLRLRAIHVELDYAVVAAYGWTDLLPPTDPAAPANPATARAQAGIPAEAPSPPLDHGFHTYRQMQRWTVSPAARTELLDRLLELNQTRAAAERSEAP